MNVLRTRAALAKHIDYRIDSASLKPRPSEEGMPGRESFTINPMVKWTTAITHLFLNCTWVGVPARIARHLWTMSPVSMSTVGEVVELR